MRHGNFKSWRPQPTNGTIAVTQPSGGRSDW
jgi:hypothetical protein